MRAIIASFGALAFATAAAAQTIPMTPDLQKVIDGAKQEKELVIEAGGAVLGGGDERIAPAMKKMFGVDFAYKFTPGGLFGVIGNKVQTEYRAGQKASTDVWLATLLAILRFPVKSDAAPTANSIRIRISVIVKNIVSPRWTAGSFGLISAPRGAPKD